MMDLDTVAPPSTEGIVPESTSQVTPPSTQVEVEPQKVEPTQVEGTVNKPQEPDAQRTRPSDFYNSRAIRSLKETNYKLEKKMNEMTTLLQELKNPKKPEASDVPSKFDLDAFVADPDKVLSEREQRQQQKLLSEITSLRQELDGFKGERVQVERDRKKQEALELLFPKSSPESNETWEDIATKNPERAEKVMQILQSTGLDKFASIDPKQAAELVLLKLNAERPLTSPKVIPKSLMGGVARGNPNPSKTASSVDDVLAEIKKLNSEVEKDPSLRFDDKFKERKTNLLAEADRLVKEKR